MDARDSTRTVSSNDPSSAVLVALRRIIRATDIYSQKLRKTVGLTTPQLLVLQAASQGDEISLGRIASELKLSQATVSNIVDRLEGRDLVTRERSPADKRRFNVHLTSAGQAVLDEAPGLLQERFVDRFARLPDWERSMIVAALQRTAALMDADEIDAAPVLYSGDVVSPR
jgi:DNA-binding MarR family transcriptional regulator